MKILVSNEFYELFRGDKDFIIPRLIAQKLGHQVVILCPTKLSLSDEHAGFQFAREIFVERLGLGPAAVRFHRPLRLIRQTHNKRMPFLLPLPSYLVQLWRIRPDCIVESIYTTLTPRSFLNWMYCALFRKPRVLLDAGDEGRNRRILPLERRAIRSARKIFTYSPGGVRRIAEKYDLHDPDKFFIHLKLLDTARFHYEPAHIRPEFTVGYVGRFIRAKGFDRFLELARNYHDPGVRFRAVGPNEEGYDMPAAVEHSDYVDNARLAEIYSAIDLLVVPDMRRCLGYSTVMQEALMCGAEVAAGCHDRSFFPKSEGVFFFDPDRPGDLVAHICRRARQTREEKIAVRQALAEEYRRATEESGFWPELEKAITGQGGNGLCGRSESP